LSYVRDAQSIIDTFDKLIDHVHDATDREAYALVRQQLTDRRKHVADDQVSLNKRLDTFLERMHEGRDRVAAWQLGKKGFKALQGGMMMTYARGYRAMREAYQNPSTENFHEWRKRAKDHGYHMQLLRPVWPGPVKARYDEADVLSDALGDDHDLAILYETLLEDRLDVGSEDTLHALLGLITQRQVELRAKAKQLGARLYAEPPKRFVKRLRRYWKAWQSYVETEPQVTQPKRVSKV
jgi:CHAD domain-containing protein